MLADSFFREDVITLAAVDEGKLVGYGFVAVALDDADLANIAVEAKYRRRGVAQGLLDRLEAQAAAAGAKRMLLEVRVSNAAAMSLYLKRGYAGLYARPRYYADGEDALVMAKDLESVAAQGG